MISEEDFEAVVGPIALAAVLAMLVGTIEEAGEVDGDFLGGLENWPVEWRENALKTLTEDATKLRDWANGLIAALYDEL